MAAARTVSRTRCRASPCRAARGASSTSRSRGSGRRARLRKWRAGGERTGRAFRSCHSERRRGRVDGPRASPSIGPSTHQHRSSASQREVEGPMRRSEQRATANPALRDGPRFCVAFERLVATSRAVIAKIGVRATHRYGEDRPPGVVGGWLEGLAKLGRKAALLLLSSLIAILTAISRH